MPPIERPIARRAPILLRWLAFVLLAATAACVHTELYEQRASEAHARAPKAGECVEIACFSNWLLTNDPYEGWTRAPARVGALAERISGELQSAVERGGLETRVSGIGAGGDDPEAENAPPTDPGQRDAIEHAWNHFHSYWKAYKGTVPLPPASVNAEARCPYTLVWRARCSDSNGGDIFLGFVMAAAASFSGGRGEITATGAVNAHFHMDLMLIHNATGTVLWAAYLQGNNDKSGTKMDARLREAMRGFPFRTGDEGASR